MVYVQRKKPQRKKKEPKAPRVIYVSDSDEDEYQQTPDIADIAAAERSRESRASPGNWRRGGRGRVLIIVERLLHRQSIGASIVVAVGAAASRAAAATPPAGRAGPDEC